MHENIDFASGIAAFEAKEFRRAMQLLSPLAEAGDAPSQFRLAVMWQNGLGVVVNEERAFEYMRLAAEQGLDIAQHGLGFMYMHGECVAKDEHAARHWFELATAQGLAGSAAALAMMCEQGLGGPADPERAKALYAEAGF